MSKQTKNVVVIGAGPAGLTAAYELLKTNENFSVTVLEESDAIGGISQTVKYNGNRMDIGGHRFFSKDEKVVNWWYEIMSPQGAPAKDDIILDRKREYPKNGVNPEIDDKVMLVRNRVSRIYFKNKFFDYPVSMSMKTIKNMGFLTTMQAGFSYIGACLHKLPETSLENFYINRFGKKLYSMFFEGYTEKLWGRHPKFISADWGSQRVKGLSVTAVIKDIFRKILGSDKPIETSLIEEFYYPKFGPGQLWETVADNISKMGGTVLKNAKVTSLTPDKNGIKSITYQNENETKIIDADYIISSMPVKDLVNAIENSTSEMKHIANGLPYRDFITVGLLVDSLKIKNETKMKTVGNIVPDCWIYVQDTSVHMGRIQIFNNWSPYMVKNLENTVWVGLEYFCNEGDELWNMPDEEYIAMAKKELELIGVIEQKDILDATRVRIKKAYPAYFDTYSEMDTLIESLNNYENLYCVGRNGQHRYNNMDHSMVTAFETVDAIRNGSHDKSRIWNVNTDKEYHEEKNN